MGYISNLFNRTNDLVVEVKEEIKRVYLSDQRPWVVGYSGGKDSTAVVQLVFSALSEMESHQLTKKVYVISSDTLVETPLIVQSINTTLNRIETKAKELNLPIETKKVKPLIEQSFWVNIIGKGYPSPNQQFRWCTDRMKIDPANKFIKEKVDTFGEVIMVLGVRESESASRASSMKSHSIEGKLLMKHSTLTNAYVYAPIRNFDIDNVWDYLLDEESPWGDNNVDLYKLYSESSGGECPLIIDQSIKESAGSCGNSRFGCWVCTVVHEDKALTGFIESGQDWLEPLLEFRNWLAQIRDDRTKRMKFRVNGQVYFNKLHVEEDEDGKLYALIPKKGYRKAQKKLIDPTKDFIVPKDKLKECLEKNNIDLSLGNIPEVYVYDENENYFELGLGPFTLETRKEILKKLLQLQKEFKHPDDPHYKLILEEELKEIRKVWFTHGDLEDSLPKIYSEVFGKELDWEEENNLYFTREEIEDLRQICFEEKVDFHLMKKLLIIQKEYEGYKVKRGLIDKISSALRQQYLHMQ